MSINFHKPIFTKITYDNTYTSYEFIGIKASISTRDGELSFNIPLQKPNLKVADVVYYTKTDTNTSSITFKGVESKLDKSLVPEELGILLKSGNIVHFNDTNQSKYLKQKTCKGTIFSTNETATACIQIYFKPLDKAEVEFICDFNAENTISNEEIEKAINANQAELI